eukprot:25745-Rhodomonas_salina.3
MSAAEQMRSSGDTERKELAIARSSRTWRCTFSNSGASCTQKHNSHKYTSQRWGIASMRIYIVTDSPTDCGGAQQERRRKRIAGHRLAVGLQPRASWRTRAANQRERTQTSAGSTQAAATQTDLLQASV